jgi:branched-chain amino acid transport system substrate-binding protein
MTLMSKYVKRTTGAIVAALLAISPVVPAGAADDEVTGKQKPIKIGYLVELSGVGAPVGQEMLKGTKLYLKQIENKMAGHPVEIVIENNASSSATAVAKTRKLIEQDKVDILNGLILTNIGYMVSPMAEKAKIPLVISICGSDDLTQRKHSDWVLRTSFSSTQSMYPFGDWVAKTLHYKRVVIVGLDYSFGWEACGGFQKSFEQAGGQVVQKIWAPLGFMDFSTYLKQIRKDADAVFICTIGNAATIVPKQYKELGFNMPIIGIGTSFDEAIIRKLGDSAIGAVSALTYSANLDTPSNKRFVQAFKAEYGTDPDFYAEGGYTSAMWIHRAVEALHGDVSDKQKFLAALKAVELKDAPRGPVKLDSWGNPVENVYVRKVVKTGADSKNAVIETFKGVGQFWKWPAAEMLKEPAYSTSYPPCKYCWEH